MIREAKQHYRIAGILFAFDPLGIAKFNREDGYDTYCLEIQGASNPAELSAILTNRGLYTDDVFRMLRHQLGFEESLDERYPCLAGEVRVIEAEFTVIEP